MCATEQDDTRVGLLLSHFNVYLNPNLVHLWLKMKKPPPTTIAAKDLLIISESS